MDSDVQATEQLDDGWEHQLLKDFVANKTSESENIVGKSHESEDEDIADTPQTSPLISTYSEAMKWAAELKIFAAEKGFAGMTCQFQRGYQLHCGFKLCKQLYCIMRRRVTRRLRDLSTTS